MDQEFRTIGGDIVVLKYREPSGQFEGGIAFGKFKNTKHEFSHGFWNRYGEAIYIHGCKLESLRAFNLSCFIEDDFKKTPMGDEIEEESA